MTWVQIPALPLPGPIASTKSLTSFTFSVLIHKVEMMTPLHSYREYEGKVHGTEILGKWSPVDFFCVKSDQSGGGHLRGLPKGQAEVPFLGSVLPCGPNGSDQVEKRLAEVFLKQ